MPHGILVIGGSNILTDYNRVMAVDVHTAQTTCTNPCTTQNARAMYHCLQGLLTGNLQAMVFHQVGSIPTHEDGPSLCKQLTGFMTMSTLQLSNLAFKNIFEFDPGTYDFVVPTINTQLVHSDQTLGENE